MNTRAVTRGTATGIAWSLAVVACRPDSTGIAPQAPIVRGAGAAATRAALEQNAWDTFDADVSVRVARADQRGAGNVAPAQYHIRRHLDGDGYWQTTIQIPPHVPQAIDAAPGSPSTSRNDVARVEDDGRGSPPRFFTANGRQIRPTVRNGDRGRVDAVRSALAGPARGDRTWVGGLIHVPAGRFDAAGDKPGSRTVAADGKVQYRKGAVTMVVDPALDAMVSMTSSDGKGRSSQRTNAYDRDAEGIVRLTSRTTQTRLPDGRAATVEVRYANITVTTVGGAR